MFGEWVREQEGGGGEWAGPDAGRGPGAPDRGRGLVRARVTGPRELGAAQGALSWGLIPAAPGPLSGYPNEAAADVVLAALREWLEQHKDKVRPGRSRGDRMGWDDRVHLGPADQPH